MGLFEFLKRKRMPATIEDAMASQAEDFVNAFSSPRAPIDAAKLDYSESSLLLVDQVLDDFYRKQAPLPEDLHFLASAYVFETARRQFGGRYLRGDQDNPFVLVIGEPDFRVGVMVMGKIRGRAVSGPEDSIPFFYAGIAPLVEKRSDATLV
ncbi:hypothetical protein FBZ99_1233 [Rhizobium sp. ERR 1071]|uniref:hypothetical protein n=1 Tax=Rhizobium sp. ERR 1071 TaxID=2572677 RepID=UPI00119B4BA4|nr:hypothetical protein [Rhizobium sp. ERR1071]TWB07925.1 hypothetical protein FBZ99_1233 [Rhizobium sp. ERR1071]